MDAQGAVTGINVVVEEVTERKRAEAALRESESRVAEGRGRVQAALEAEQRKNEFLAVLSHELRNPLTPIRNSLYILDRATPGGEAFSRAVKIIDRQIAHMTRLIEDLLDVTRISCGKIQLQSERIELGELMRRTVDDHYDAFGEAGIALEIATVPYELWVRGDRTRLAQVLGNLLQNAAKFTSRGGTTSVAVQHDTTQQMAIVRVLDTGRGIAPEVLPRLFEPFTQADATLDRKMGGLGLGLALVRGLVEMHGGSVSAASGGLGKGASFTIRLPIERTRHPEMQPPANGVVRSARRVLIIEDNADAADSLRVVLEIDGHEVEVAHDGLDGLAKARSFAPEVVLCDIGLPEMDGYEVARAMRADPHNSRVRLIALTGYAAPEDVAKAKEAGFDAHLGKPTSMGALARVLALEGVQKGEPTDRPLSPDHWS
jgi:two-component system CheB/CheR fusion protein